jgi:hypothetical protein
MHKHDIPTLKRRANQARALAELVAEPAAASRLLGAALGYEIEAEMLEDMMADEPPPRTDH